MPCSGSHGVSTKPRPSSAHTCETSPLQVASPGEHSVLLVSTLGAASPTSSPVCDRTPGPHATTTQMMASFHMPAVSHVAVRPAFATTPKACHVPPTDQTAHGALALP